MSLLCKNQTDSVTKDYNFLYVSTLNYTLDVQISCYKLEGGKLVDNQIRFVYHFFVNWYNIGFFPFIRIYTLFQVVFKNDFQWFQNKISTQFQHTYANHGMFMSFVGNQFFDNISNVVSTLHSKCPCDFMKCSERKVSQCILAVIALFIRSALGFSYFQIKRSYGGV